MITRHQGTLAPGLIPHQFAGETSSSYASRLEARLGMDQGYLWSLARANQRHIEPDSMTGANIRARLTDLCIRMAGFVPSAAEQGMSPHVVWHACMECVGGLAIQVVPDNNQLVCCEHKRWTGPSVGSTRTSPGRPPEPGEYSSVRVSDAVAEADIQFENLIKHRPLVTPALIDQIWARIASAKKRRYRGVPTPSDFPMAVALLSVLTDPDFISRLFDPAVTFKQGYAILAEAITTKLPKAGWAIIDQAWLLLRTTFVSYRVTKLGEKGVTPFVPVLALDVTPGTVMYPLEPMGRYLDCLHTNNRMDGQWWLDRFLVPQAAPQSEELLICGNGHIQRTTRAHAHRSRNEVFRCPICSGKHVVPGLNSMGDVMPILAKEWDHAANGDLTPFMVSTGSNRKVGWICSRGHHYQAYIMNRTLQRTGCKLCAGNTLVPGANDLASTYPELAALWDDNANGDLKPNEIAATNTTIKVQLRCVDGHTFARTPFNLIQSQGRCPKCSGRILVPGDNDLLTQRPDIAAWWHPTRNGTLMPSQVRARSYEKVHWLCPDGHSFEAAPVYLSDRKKLSCPVDTGRLLSPGENDLATKEPALVRDWDSKRNGFEPSETVPGRRAYIWTCKMGHTLHVSVVNRRRSGGCTDCPPEERVAAGERKNTRGRNGWDTRRA